MASYAYQLMFLLFVGVVLLVEARVALQPEEKIVGGKEIDITKVPWQVALLFNDDYYWCGGTIISDQWIISAAHCTEINVSHLSVRVGSSNHSAGQLYKLEKVVNHAEYDPQCHNDISALKTVERIIFSQSVAKALLPASGAPPLTMGTELLVSGWGRTSNADNGEPPSSKLMAVKIEVVEFWKCVDAIPYFEPDESMQLCAGSDDGRNSCKGDSGGPLVRGEVLVGIVSYGDPDCGKYSVVYTKVSTYRDWIKEITGV